MSDSFVTLWTVAHQASPSMEFSRQEYWSRFPFPSPGESSWLRWNPGPFIGRQFLYHWDTWDRWSLKLMGDQRKEWLGLWKRREIFDFTENVVWARPCWGWGGILSQGTIGAKTREVWSRDSSLLTSTGMEFQLCHFLAGWLGRSLSLPGSLFAHL